MLFGWYKRLSRTTRVMFAVEGLVFLFLLAVGLTLIGCVDAIRRFEGPLAFSVGLLSGCALSAVKIVLLEKTLTRAVDMGEQAKNYATLHATLRYFGTIIVLAPAVIFRGAFGVIGVVAGLLSLQLAAFATSLAIKKEAFGADGEKREKIDNSKNVESADIKDGADGSIYEEDNEDAYAKDKKDIKDLWD